MSSDGRAHRVAAMSPKHDSSQSALKSPRASKPGRRERKNIKRQEEQTQERLLYINDTEHSHFSTNRISTSKYSKWSFFPRALFEQFRRLANVYFLVLSMLMLLGTYVRELFTSPLTPWSTLGPLVIVLGLTMMKEGFEDAKRHRSDRRVNNRIAEVLNEKGEFVHTRWEDLKVGQVARLENQHEVPADMILLHTAEPRGTCYVETSNIDGETNIKVKEAVQHIPFTPESMSLPNQDTAEIRTALGQLRGSLTCEAPNADIHTFGGTLRFVPRQGFTNPSPGAGAGAGAGAGVGAGSEERKTTIPVGPNNFVLRGCSIKNVDFSYGLIVYTGEDTKVMKKSVGVRSKMSRVETMVNKIVWVILGAQFLLAAVSTLMTELWDANHNVGETPDLVPYLRLDESIVVIPEWLSLFLTFIVLFNNFIPISLYVTIEFVNYIQAMLIEKDREMYDEETSTPAKARTSNLNQDLGQIEYLFSDKTGTLTRNVMEFRSCAIGGAVFGERPFTENCSGSSDSVSLVTTPSRTERRKRSYGEPEVPGQVRVTPRKPEMRVESFSNGEELSDQKASGVSETSLQAGFPREVWSGLLSRQDKHEMEKLGVLKHEKHLPWQSVECFLRTLALCHSIVPEHDEHGFRYQAESPDELALAEAARAEGVVFVERDTRNLCTLYRKKPSNDAKSNANPFNNGPKYEAKYQVYGIHEFNSSRRRMSVILRRVESDGNYGPAIVLTKGADDVMIERAVDNQDLDGVKRQLSHFAQDGLRTLLFGVRLLSEQDFNRWSHKYEEARRRVSGREEALGEVATMVENNLILVGASAIEDRLQDRVPETIRDIRQAGIKVWVLTGDKVETAINIGYSTKLINQHSFLLKVTKDDTAARDLQSALRTTEAPGGPMELLERQRELRSQKESNPAPSQLSNRRIEVQGRSQSRNALPVENLGSPEHDEEADAHFSLVITGAAVSRIFESEEEKKKLLDLAIRCRSVIACRVSPSQKAQLVRLVRRGLKHKPMTLAIGDGANDVAMIQQAEVGVGISGKEGLQAVNASDFAIAQFRFLRRLLFVHGHWNYRRMARVFLYSFFKNIVMTGTLFIYTFFTGFSGTSLYESLVYSGFNFFLGLPIIGIGILDRDVSQQRLERDPRLYIGGLKHMHLNLRIMLGWILSAAILSCFIVFIPLGAYYNPSDPVAITLNPDGKTDGLFVFGLVVYTALIMTMQLKVAMETTTWTWVTHLLLWLSIGGYFLFLILYNVMLFFAPDIYFVAFHVWAQPGYWLITVLVCGIFILFDWSISILRVQFKPRFVDLVMESERIPSLRRRPSVRAWYSDDEKHGVFEV